METNFQVKFLILLAATSIILYAGYHLPSFNPSSTKRSNGEIDPEVNAWLLSLVVSTHHSDSTSLPDKFEKITQTPERITTDVNIFEGHPVEVSHDRDRDESSVVDRSSRINVTPAHETQQFSSEHEIIGAQKHVSTLSNRKKLSDSDQEIDKLPFKKYPTRNLKYLYDESKDVFDLLPTSYLQDYKSFCWHDARDGFHCLASVYLAGMPKCGTTDLFYKLMWHPELTAVTKITDSGSEKYEKERFYWTRSRIGRPISFLANPRVPPPKTDFSHYLSNTANVAEKVKTGNNLRIVDGTPSLLWDLGGWEKRYPGLDEPPYSNGNLIHAVTPDAKILAILRNPIDRLYSEYLYFWKSGKMSKEPRTPDTFHLDVLRETHKFNRCLMEKSLRHCCYSSDRSMRLRVALGVYFCYINDFEEVFGDNLLVVTMKEYQLHPIETLSKIFDRIGVSQPSVEDLRSFIETSKTYNVNTDIKIDVGKMHDETRDLLTKFYHPYNLKLAELLNDPKFLFA